MIESRAVQEVQAALIIAKAHPRDEEQSYARIMSACKLRALAESATYLYSRGGTDITGPTIDLLETICRNWGNVQCGIVEIDRKHGESTVLAFAWDMETNFYDQKTFTVRHWRDTKSGGYALTDERDIYELIANMGARRKRSCMEAIVPQYVIDDAVAACDRTLKANAEPIDVRIKKMVEGFAQFKVTAAMIEKRLGHKVSECAEQELLVLRKIYTSLKKEGSKVEQWFETPTETVTPGKTVHAGRAGPEDDVPYDSPTAPVVTGEAAATPAASAQAHPTPAAAGEPRKRRSKSTLVEEPVTPTATAQPEQPPAPEPTPEAPLAMQPPQPITGFDPEVAAEVLTAIKQRLHADKFTMEELMGFCVRTGVAKPTQKDALSLSTKKLLDLCANWPAIVVELQIMRTGG